MELRVPREEHAGKVWPGDNEDAETDSGRRNNISVLYFTDEMKLLRDHTHLMLALMLRRETCKDTIDPSLD